MENTWFSGFTIKVNIGVYEVCTSPKMRNFENSFQHVFRLTPGSEAF